MNESDGAEYDFREVQRFRQKRLWALLLPTTAAMVAIFGYGMVRQLGLGHPWGSRPMPDVALAIIGSLAIVLAVGTASLLYAMKMVTEVRRDGIHIRFFPVASQLIPFDAVRGCEVRTYRPIREYGGWGIRYGPSGKAYNVSGDRGVLLRLAGERKLMIGSLRADELARSIDARRRGQS